MKVSLYPHQERVFNLLMAGKSVILQAPTGSGKTRAALYPFLTAIDPSDVYYGKLPLKCIYSVPMRILAKQFYIQYKKTVASYNLKYALSIQVRIQTGETPTDPCFNADLIFATIDQTLSSYLLAPYSLSRARANINAGAIASSYLVFDEFHLYDPDSTLPSTLAMLKRLRGITPFILMTATFSSDMLESLAHELDAVIVPGSEAERAALQSLPSQQKERRYQVADRPLSASAVLELHDRRSLVICNRVARARSLYRAIRALASPEMRVILLHSQFLRGDRDRIEDEIRSLFEKGNSDGSVIVIATQAIEVGVDITSTVLHTELAPANAILQRAGRCARYHGESGCVIVYAQVETDDGVVDLTEDEMPYAGQAQQFVLTLDHLREWHDTPLTFTDEQALISAVHGERDRAAISRMRQREFEHMRGIASVQRGDRRVDPRHLIRETASQQVTLHANPTEMLEAPFDYPAFSLHPGTMQGYIRRWLEAAESVECPFSVQWLHELTGDDDAQANRVTYNWERVTSPKDAWGAPLIVVHPALATYEPETGFMPERGGGWSASYSPPEDRSGREPRQYHLETYADHIQRVHDAFVKRWPELAWAARQIEKRAGWEQRAIYRAAELAVLLHDVGKLSTAWQGWVRTYQARINRPVDDSQAYAHTDRFTPEHVEVDKAMPRRPWHAVEGALASAEVLFSQLPETLAKAAFSAVARHHTPHSSEYRAFRLMPKSPKWIAETIPPDWALNLAGLHGVTAPVSAHEPIQDLFADPTQDDDYLAYLLIARALRLSDQEGTKAGSVQL
jgi:CRISPR-associated endonuclease/helicase Cas3